MASDLRRTSPQRRCHHALDAVLAGLSGLRSHGVQDGAKITTLGRAMGSDCRFVSPPPSHSTGRKTTTSSARVSRGDSVGPANRSPLERFTRMFSFFCDMLAQVEGMVVIRRVPHRLESCPQKTGQDGPNRLDASTGGWHIRPCKKGGACVGKTKCGKGSKIMVLA